MLLLIADERALTILVNIEAINTPLKNNDLNSMHFIKFNVFRPFDKI